MAQAPISDEAIARRKREREQAEAHYAEALAAVERARPGSDPQAALDEDTLQPWEIVRGDPLASLTGWRRRLAGFVWRLVGPMLQQQQTFNHVIAYNLARPLTTFHLQLIHYLRQVSLLLEYRVSDGMSALADELAKRWESMVAREQRYEGRVAALAAREATDATEARTAIASLQQVSHMLTREMERLLAASAGATAVAEPASRPPSDGQVLDAYKYVGFEDQFRGSVEDIRARMCDYLPLFAGASDVLDIGCGRGEFLQLLAGQGVTARGIDINHEMVEVCRERGLEVAEGDLVEYLASLPDRALGGLFAAQVVEHLEPDRLMRLLGLAFDKLRPGARVVLETINPACWSAFFDSYIRDLTHVRPVHPDTLKYLLLASGFQQLDIQYRAPYPEAARLRPIAIPAAPADATAVDWTLLDFAETFNANVATLNAQLFTYRDYAAVAVRP